MTTESFPSMTVPLRVEPGGAIRVSNPQARVNLEFVVWSHKAGETPEQIKEALPALELADIYAVIAYYLRNTEDVEAYLRDVERAEERAIAEIDARHPDNASILERLQARRDAAKREQRAS
ncbi:MAG: DUF433 domain-containing protein [Chloroflexota bacterium]|nr:DUF433 domain-containing protein [Chloroflexota bacterium]MDE2885564.1 DUF433 domain-containing protein [Chloroflexota bacterium]